MLETAQQIRDVLSPAARRSVWGLLALVLLSTVLESLSVGVVVPVLSALADPGWIERHPSVAGIAAALGATSSSALAIWAMAALVCVYAIKTVCAATLAYCESRFAYAIQAQLSTRLFAAYLRQPWVFHLQRNTAELIRNCTVEPHYVAVLTSSALYVLSEVLVSLAIVALLIMMEPRGALVALVTFGGSVAAFHYVVRGRLARWGELRQDLERDQLRHLQQGFGGVKEIKLCGREGYFEQAFTARNTGVAHTLHRQQFVGQLPRLWLESVALLGIAVLVVVVSYREGSLAQSLPALGLFAAAAFRLLPSFSRLMGALQTIRFRTPSLRLLHRELMMADDSKASTPAQQHTTVSEILLDNVCFAYEGTTTRTLDGVCLRVRGGTTIGLVGASGSGKSTLIDVILGLLTPCAGAVRVDGRDVRHDLLGWQRSIGYVPQSIYLMDDTIRRNVAFGMSDPEIRDDMVWRALTQASIEDFVRSLPLGLDTVTGERGVRLSGGQRQRLGIARALFHDPAVLVLDEATSALDTSTESEVMQAVGALHGTKTVILVAHNLTTLANCDRVFQMQDGVLVQASLPM
jgi:ABC-type bacteriocin/lantibiotic exporter with double-glycine peptidase domain